jgi:hydrogenase maturation protein HypF
VRQLGSVQRLRLRVRGAVQGVGFRPFVYRLAQELGVTGWIANDPAGVIMEIEADDDQVAAFLGALHTQAPPRAQLHDVSAEVLPAHGSTEFRILESDSAGAPTAVVLPDMAMCDDCRHDIERGGGRREGYAFTNCTNCGPRFSIIRSLPYDRPNTTMAGFIMCAACSAEYTDPLDRRFHAQPNACAACGPRVALLGARGTLVDCSDAIAAAAAALRGGLVVAVKGIGGYHLMVVASDDQAVADLRQRKHRPARPLAIMAADLAQARRFVTVDDAAAALLESPEAPIVLLPRREARAGRILGDVPLRIAGGVAPDNPNLGVMLAATPLHHLLLAAVGEPVVATSGNLAEEPICIDEHDAVERLHGIADLFLVHDRPIERHVDDSVAIIMDGAPRLLRRARGHAPLPIRVPVPIPPILAVGPHLKNTVALSSGNLVFISQHIGDLETPQAQHALDRVIGDFLELYATKPVAIAHDMHPDYSSTARAQVLAGQLGVPAFAVQHHHAHMLACMAENGETRSTLGVVWDGTGYGTDGTIWGGEFLVGDATGFQRAAHLLPFRLPGGEKAVREPRRVAAALLHGTFGADALRDDAPVLPLPDFFAPVERRTLGRMIEQGLNSPVTTSAGRLFDGVAALLGLCAVSSYEGEAAIRLEHAADPREHGAYDMPWVADAEVDDSPFLLDWRPMVRDVLTDARRGVATGVIAARVHNAFVQAITLQAELVGCDRVALSGGCFQNRLLTERTAASLRHHGFTVLQHRQVPANDGGVALGQVIAAAARLAASS